MLQQSAHNKEHNPDEFISHNVQNPNLPFLQVIYQSGTNPKFQRQTDSAAEPNNKTIIQGRDKFSSEEKDTEANQTKPTHFTTHSSTQNHTKPKQLQNTQQRKRQEKQQTNTELKRIKEKKEREGNWHLEFNCWKSKGRQNV